MTDTCPVPSPDERKYMAIQQRAETAMMAKIMTALDEAASSAGAEFKAESLDMPPPALEYFIAVAHQKLFVRLAGGDPETLQGGDIDMARRILESGKNLSEHYWGTAAK